MILFCLSCWIIPEGGKFLLSKISRMSWISQPARRLYGFKTTKPAFGWRRWTPFVAWRRHFPLTGTANHTSFLISLSSPPIEIRPYLLREKSYLVYFWIFIVAGVIIRFYYKSFAYQLFLYRSISTRSGSAKFLRPGRIYFLKCEIFRYIAE